MKFYFKGALTRIACIAAGLMSPQLSAQDIPRARLLELIQPSLLAVQHLALNPAVMRVTELANEQALDAAEIARRDAAWVDEAAGLSLRHTVTNNRTARLLARHVQANGAFTEAFLTDNRGATVAAFPPTSDYWQGDEEKFIESYNGGNGQVLVGPVELDASTNTYQAQISAPVLIAGETAGVLIIGVQVDGMQATVAAAQ